MLRKTQVDHKILRLVQLWQRGKNITVVSQDDRNRTAAPTDGKNRTAVPRGSTKIILLPKKVENSTHLPNERKKLYHKTIEIVQLWCGAKVDGVLQMLSVCCKGSPSLYTLIIFNHISVHPSVIICLRSVYQRYNLEG